MTNYNERLDEVFKNVDTVGQQFGMTPDELKQAITSLMKELVADAKPHTRLPDDSPTADEDLVNYGHNEAIDQFEQNLLKALEEN